MGFFALETFSGGSVQTSKAHHPKVFPQPTSVPLSPADSMETVNEVEPPTAPLLTATGSAQRKPSMDELLSAVEPVLSEALVTQVGASYQVNIALPSGTRSTYFIDLSSGHHSGVVVSEAGGYFVPVPPLHAANPTELGGRGSQTKPIW